jgi:hypothetical protein
MVSVKGGAARCCALNGRRCATPHIGLTRRMVMRIRDLAATRPRYGCFRIDILLRREGWFVNHKGEQVVAAMARITTIRGL